MVEVWFSHIFGEQGVWKLYITAHRKKNATHKKIELFTWATHIFISRILKIRYMKIALAWNYLWTNETCLQPFSISVLWISSLYFVVFYENKRNNLSTFVSSHCSTAHNKIKTSITHNLAKIGLGKEHSWDYNWCCCIMCIGKTNDPFSSTWPFLEYITDETGCFLTVFVFI